MERISDTEHANGFGCCLLVLCLIVAVIVLLQIGAAGVDGRQIPEGADTQEMLRSPAVRAFAVGLLFAALAGLVLALVFLMSQARELAASPVPRIQPSVLLISFLVFLVGFLIVSGITAVLADFAGVDAETESGALAYVVLQTVVMLTAFALGLSALSNITRMTREDPREIGWRVVTAVRSLTWGIGGYMAALPFMLVALLISQAIFRGIQTPEHPIVRTIIESRAAYAAAAVLAVVVAPLVEETMFRGMLYTALRSRLGVWSSSVVSGVFFAAIHPTLPAGFLPILVLGIVLAVVRERTGSLFPCMICHGANNAVALALVRLVYPSG